jgi:two-component system, NarL family, response regulator NreC
MPDLDGAEATRQLIEQRPGMRVVALTRHADQGYLRRMLRAGASGYVLKRNVGEALIVAIRAVMHGGTAIDPLLTAALVAPVVGSSDIAPGRPPKQDLSEREGQVLRRVAWGCSNKEAAASLGLSVKTVESYRATAVEKLQLRTRSDILRYAISQGWMNEDEGPE